MLSFAVNGGFPSPGDTQRALRKANRNIVYHSKPHKTSYF